MPQAQITLTPLESKRLIAKAVAKLPEVQSAMREGVVVVGVGTTNACVVEELLGEKIDHDRFMAGRVLPEGTSVLPREQRLKEVVIERGKAVDARMDEVLPRLGPKDVFIKGANALDAMGTAGIFLAGEGGGTIGRALGTLKLKGVKLVIPVGLEKFIPGRVEEVAELAGTERFDFSTGVPVGLMPVRGKIVTELEAVKILTRARARVMGKGGIKGAEGAVTLLVEGTGEQIEDLKKLVQEIKA